MYKEHISTTSRCLTDVLALLNTPYSQDWPHTVGTLSFIKWCSLRAFAARCTTCEAFPPTLNCFRACIASDMYVTTTS